VSGVGSTEPPGSGGAGFAGAGAGASGGGSEPLSLAVNDGRPVFVAAPHERIGQGPWARWLATAVVPDEGSTRAERGRTLARSGHVHSVIVTEGKIVARVIGSTGSEYDVTLTAAPVPARVWAAVSGSARGRSLLDVAISGDGRSVQLEHLMAIDWDEPLVPRARSLRRSCTCPDDDFSGVCKHLAALAYVLADEIDRDLTPLLRWRGCSIPAEVVPETRRPEFAARDDLSDDPWRAGPLPELGPPRALPVGAVIKRLGRSGLRVMGDDLADALQPAYAAFARSGRR
jgi:uncharacterized Zn finger protein